MSPSTNRWMGVRDWETRDLLIVAALGIVPGVALLPVIFAGFSLRAALGPLATVLYTGLFYLPGLMALYVVRKPGASILNGVFVGLVWVPLSPFGLAVTVPAVVARVGSEIPFLVTRYRRYDRPLFLIGGASAGLFSLGAIYIPFSYQQLAIPIQVGLVVGHAVGGALLGGLSAQVLSEKIAETGVLSAYPLARTADLER